MSYISTAKKVLTDWVFISLLALLWAVYHYGASLLPWTLLIGYLLTFTYGYLHDTLCHGYYTTKKFFGFDIKHIFDIPSMYLFHIPLNSYAMSPYLDYKLFHGLHHSQWNREPEKDEHQWVIENNPIWMQLLIPNLKKYDHKTPMEYKRKFLEKWREEHNISKFRIWIDDNYRAINSTFHISSLLLLGPQYYLFFVLGPIYLSRLHRIWFADIYPHLDGAVESYWKERQEGRSENFLKYLINPIHYHHLDHHEYNSLSILGRWKYLSFYYWFVKLFCEVKPTTNITPK